MIRALTISLMILAPLGAPLQARSPGDVAEVRNGLLAVAAGDMIQRECDGIAPRLIRVYTLRNQLLSAARAAGFSRDEIDDFVEDDASRSTIKAEARSYLTARGLDPAQPSSYCAVGKAEIRANTAVGRLLRD